MPPHDLIIIKVKDPRKQQHQPIIVTFKDPRHIQKTLTPTSYRNPHVYMHHFSIPTPKKQDPSASQPQLRRSKRYLKMHGFLSQDQLNSVTPSLSPRVGCTPPRVDPSLSLALPELHAVLHPISGVQCEYRHLSSGKVPGQCPLVWKRAFSNKLGRLSQGTRDVKGTSTISFIPFKDVPCNKTSAYGCTVSNIKPHK